MLNYRHWRHVRAATALFLAPIWLSGTVPVVEAQDMSLPSEPSADSSLPCPPSLSAIYTDPGTGLTFTGLATLQMMQWDEYLLAQVYTYRFVGYTADRRQKIAGFAHIASEFCAQAYYAWFRGITVPIARLHNVTLYQVSCNDSMGGGSTTIVDAFYSTEYDPYSSTGASQGCSSAGGSTDGDSESTGSSSNCHVEYLIIEISYDGGRTWSTYWEGYGTVCG